MQRTLKLASLTACCAIAITAFAQDETRRPRDADQPPGAQPGQPGEGQVETRAGRRGLVRGAMQVQDRDLAQLLTIGNRGEVEMSTFAKDKSQNEKVKEFAEMMVKDHSTCLEKLAAFTGPRAGQPAVGNAETVRQPGQPPVAVKANTEGVRVDAGPVGIQVGNPEQGGARSFYAPGTNPIITLKDEVAQECIASAKKELGAKEGAEFDKCFIGMQIGKHAEMISCLTVYQRKAQDSQFKEMLGESLTKTQQHLEMAKNIMKTLEKPAQ